MKTNITQIIISDLYSLLRYGRICPYRLKSFSLPHMRFKALSNAVVYTWIKPNIFGVWSATLMAYFFFRPRRFGKSLFLSTLDAFFPGRKELFKGLTIEKLAPGEREEYPIILWPEPEVQTSSGRIDLVVKVKDWTFIFELKMLRDGQNTDALLDTALCQAIDEKQYADKYRGLSSHIRVVAVVFDADSRRLAAWKTVDVS